MHRYPNITAYQSATFYEFLHANSSAFTLVNENHRDLDEEIELNKALRSRLQRFNDHGTTERV